MQKLKRILCLFCIIILGIVSFNLVGVNALEDSYKLTKGGAIWYSNSGYIIKHYFGSTPAYCLQWRLSTYNGSTYSKFTPTSMTERNAFIAGYAIKLVEEDYPDNENMRHLYATEAINCLFGLSGSVCYQKGKDYITEATNYVDNEQKLCEGTNTSGCLNNENFKLSLKSSTLNQIGATSNFVSNKITLSGLIKTYGGNDYGVTYKIDVTSSKGDKVEICSNANGTGCSGSSLTLTDKEGDYSFYVKVSDATAASTVKINATATNSATYPYGVAYRYTSSYQALMIKDEKTLTRNLSRVATLNVPDKTKYTISARKVDENGEDLTGASFEIYRAELDTGKEIKVLKKNSDGSSTLSYVEEEFTNASEWFNYQYCLRETKAPSGYVYNEKNELENPLCLTVSKSKSTYCFNEENGEESDVEKCNSHTKVCSSTQGELIEGTDDCRLTQEITTQKTDAKASCPDGYTIDLDGNRCVKESDDSLMEITSETIESSDVISEYGYVDEVEISYSCDAGERVENEDGTVSCVTTSCSGEGYSYDEELKVCTKVTEASVCHSDRSAYSGNENVDMSYCEDQSSYTFVTVSGGNIDFVKTNNRNSVTISKVDITGEKELSGAKMKICTTKPNDKLECQLAVVTKSGQCTDASLKAGTCTNNNNNTMNVEVSWVSDSVPRTIRGLEAGKTYYLVETVAPLGYKTSQYTQFSISEDGVVTSGNAVMVDNKVLVKNDLSKFSVSKQDAATSKELPGAEITICYAGRNEKGEYQMGVDEEGNCTVPTLLSGEDAKWISTSEPHVIEGLSAGAYYLVETITPDGYDTAEKILFILNQDGTLTDKDGNSLKDNKLVMLDKPIKQTPTGDMLILIVVLLGAVGLGIGVYYYFKIYKNKTK